MNHVLRGTLAVGALLAASACTPMVEVEGRPGVLPAVSFPVTDNETPYSACLRSLAPMTTLPDGTVINYKPRIAVAEIYDKTGQYEQEGLSRPLTQGVTDMLYSAFHKTRKVSLIERSDMRIPLAEMKLVEQNAIVGRNQQAYQITPTDFVIMGSQTELDRKSVV